MEAEIIKLLLVLGEHHVRVNGWEDVVPLLAQLDKTITIRAMEHNSQLVRDNLMLEYGLYVDIIDGRLYTAQYDTDALLYQATMAKRYNNIMSFEEMLRRDKAKTSWEKFFSEA